MPLDGRDLSRIKTGFGWSGFGWSRAGQGKPVTFYPDDTAMFGNCWIKPFRCYTVLGNKSMRTGILFDAGAPRRVGCREDKEALLWRRVAFTDCMSRRA
jgi:hypothetical protein